MLRSSLHLLFVVAASAVALVACGSDTTSTTSTGTGSGGGTTSATGTGGSTTSGTGGNASTSTATGTGTGTASSSGTGMAVMNACTNAADAAIIMSKDVKAITTMCGQENGGAEVPTKNCIKKDTGLSDDCAGCYSGQVACIADHCLGAEGKCLIAPNDQLCTDCRKKYCVPAYEACSGNKSM